jgi:hypothetical protein
LQKFNFSDLGKIDKEIFMCGKKKRDPRIDEEQKKAREEAEAAKEIAEREKEEERLKLEEEQKQQQQTEADKLESDMGKSDRQSELQSTPETPSLAALRRRSKRGSRAGRSLLRTSSAGGAGYYSRFT